MADTQIRGLGASPAPLTYTVPGAQEIILKSLFASFDGTAAASPWYPCVRVRAPGGGIVGEYITQATVAAGAKADVSFAPFLRGATAASGSGVSVYSDGSLVATEPGIDFEDGVAVFWSFADNPGAGYVSVTPNGPYYSTGAATVTGLTVTSGAAKEVGFSNLIVGGGLVTTHAVGGLSGFSLADLTGTGGSSGPPAFVTFSVAWPAGAYSRYVEVALDSPQAYGTPTPMTYPSPVRFTAATTPEGDYMSATALVVPVHTGSPIRLNVFQSSGVNKAIDVSCVVEASLMREV